jgi:lipoate-protein ligase A
MKDKWRLIITENLTAARNMAIDSAILMETKKRKTPPTIRFYSWNPPAISIGYFQSLIEEVNLDLCNKYGVEYVRRITGGGAVFHENELTYSIVISESHPKIPKNIIESYKRICGAIIQGLRNICINSCFAPINDITVDDKKISGNAQTRKNKLVLQHGTILIDVDIEKMFSILNIPNEKIRDKLIADVKDRVTSIRHILGHKVTFNDLTECIKSGFEKEFNIELMPGNLTREELKLAETLEKQKFSSRKWNHLR